MKLVWAYEFASITEAFAWEKRVQNWSRAKRLALIEGRFDALPMLASSDPAVRRGLDKLGHLDGLDHLDG